jgi:hypothetical protein
MNWILLISVMGFLLPKTLGAQDGLPHNSEDRKYKIKINPELPNPSRGYLVTIQDSSLYLSAFAVRFEMDQTGLADLQKFDCSDLQLVKIHQKGVFGKSVLIGLASGLAGGLALAAWLNTQPQPGQIGPPSITSQWGNLLAGGLVGATLGAGTGAICGSFTGKKFYILGEWKNLEEMKQYLQKK